MNTYAYDNDSGHRRAERDAVNISGNANMGATRRALGYGIAAASFATGVGEAYAAVRTVDLSMRVFKIRLAFGNPFKGKSAKQIDELLKDKGYNPKGPNPEAGKGKYIDPKTGESFHLDLNHPAPKGPHVGQIRPRGQSQGGRKGRNGRDYPL